MVSKRKKKYSTGEGAQFYSRKQALKKLQLSLNDFRRLCIIKGIYPREPRNRKRAQQGSTLIKTLYHKKDIQFLMHEPIIWKLREYKIFNRKVGRARAMKDFESMRRYLENHPTLKLDHIVKERYPTFIDALRDLDDCLTLCFLFSTFPSLAHIPREQSALCRRLTIEFLHAVIEAKALRKVFISIKGYYYQAEIKGQNINWIVPHHFAFEPQSKEDVDFKVMSTFVEFYTIMLGFVNFRLYHSLNLTYPPKFSGLSGPNETEKSLVDENIFVSERIQALNFPISRTVVETAEEEIEIDNFDTDDDPQKLEEKKQEAEKTKKLKTLFKGFKFYINREVPREPLVFIIRCFGGEVSWDKMLFVGATFDDTDETITHHIVDRPTMEKQYISRYYIQPQWIFDSVNARELLPVSKYFIGAVLPPHLSPFVDQERNQEYIPPEEQALRDQTLIEKHERASDSEDESEEDDDNKEENENDDENQKSEDEIEDDEDDDDEDDESDEEDNESDDEDSKMERKAKKQKMAVKPGEVYKEVPWEGNRQAKQEFRLREKMIKKKHRNLYKSMMAGRKDRAKEIWLLRKKRRLLDEKETEEKKIKKKQLKDNESEAVVLPNTKKLKQNKNTETTQVKKGKNVEGSGKKVQFTNQESPKIKQKQKMVEDIKKLKKKTGGSKKPKGIKTK